MTFSHLHVASGYSLQYGTATPQAIAERAAEHGQSIVGLTDRDGLYGAVRWMLACQSAGISPVLGVDVAMEETSPAPRAGARGTGAEGAEPPRRSPAHGGTWLDEDRPRVLLLAADARGWASLCRLVSAAHTGPHTERGRPWLTWAALREHSEGVVALLTADSEVGRLFTSQRIHRAAGVVRPWRAIFGPRLGIAVTSHRAPARHRHATATAAAMLGWARSERLPVVLTNAVRYLQPEDARVADVLDSARRLVPLDSRHIEPDNGEAFLKDAAQMSRLAEEIAVAAGERDGRRLIADTQRLAEYCALAPADLGMGEVFVPELDVLIHESVPAAEANARADALLRERCTQAIEVRYPRPVDQRQASDRLEEELRTITHLQFSGYFLTVAEVVELVKVARRAGRRPGLGGGQPGQPPARHLRGRPDPARPADGAVPVAAAPGAARHRHRRRVRPARGDLPVDLRPVRARAHRLRLDDGDLPGAARRARRGGGAGHAGRRGRRLRQVLPAHPGP